MEHRRLGQLEVSAIGLGCATMTPFYGEPDPAAAITTIRRATALGIDFLDTSDAYGNGRNEELISQAVDGRRHEYVIASKFGNLRHRNGTPTADGRPEYVTAACERSPFRHRGQIPGFSGRNREFPVLSSKRRRLLDNIGNFRNYVANTPASIFSGLTRRGH
jgi:hypothetical protein